MSSRSRSRFGWLVLVWAALGTHVPAGEKPAAEFSFHYDHILGTSLDIRLVAPSAADAQKAEQAILDEIERLRLVFSTYDPKSEISLLNRSSGPTAASAEMIEVLREYESWQRRSAGAFNGQLGELIRTWAAAEKAGAEPSAEKLARIVRTVNRPGWEIDAANHTVTRITDQPLDLNSIGKGSIIQKSAAAARAKVPALQGLLLNIGGDMLASGVDGDGKSWAVGVQDPFRPEDNAPVVAAFSLNGRAIATSGGYQRYYTINGRRYSHIFDPRTGRPAEDVASSTVIARDNVTANALATTLCVLSPEDGLHLVAATPGAECLLITADGRQLRSPGVKRWEIPLVPVAVKAMPGEDAKGDTWPADYRVSFSIELPKPTEGRKIRRPYVAIWVEGDNGKPVRSIVVWGDQPKYQRDLSVWWGKIDRTDRAMLKAVTRSTRAPGKYEVVWDGKDDRGKPVPQGTYTVRVEVHREHGKHVTQTGKLECRTEGAKITLEKNAETEATIVEYGKKK
jgi:thiamine biosynthesis lipoprotein ApbE